ncbi:hypothetical protein [Flavobacterium sp.]|uniref:hypothetical protein n=1 Tax=Flavobacterium sp. TaxID=239 RepID=UPI0025C4001F|nr:hypothetical protein [Flavobacterium sp.]MBA4154323.1 hypothetical protein [Flavobacterium sp.]
MKNQLFEDLKSEIKIELHETLKVYCDTIWNVYEETNVVDFENTINRFLKKLNSKANSMYFENHNIYWCTNDLEINEIIHKCLLKTLKVTNWDNIKVENNINYIINIEKAINYQDRKNDDFDIFLLENPDVFFRIYNHFINFITN